MKKWECSMRGPGNRWSALQENAETRVTRGSFLTSRKRPFSPIA